ncbi:DNA repair protein RadA [Candidatus Babeliales bacterium]|nr:DNA repair protein RadA [Candidatus Babeliales bacterium]
MPRPQSSYKCNNCSHESSKWLGCCPQCEAWNTFTEEKIIAAQSIGLSQRVRASSAELFRIGTIRTEQKARLVSGIHEWDRVMGGGILSGSLILLAGDPGVGKSTLILQVANNLAKTKNVFYFSSEESLSQVKHRATRLGLANSNIQLSDCYKIENIAATLAEQKPDLVIIDSIQSCCLETQRGSMPGSISQLRESTFLLMHAAKQYNVAILVTGHITKDGNVAGPKLMEHMVDGVFYLQGEDRWQSRILRSVKNRFGTINEVGFFDMGEHGLEEISNINQRFLAEASFAPGSTLICSTEGSRPLILEAQALCIESKFGSPQRVITGIEHKRVVLIAAILEKYLHVKLSCSDIFFKVSGGVFVKESASDLGIALALLSTYFQKPLPLKSLALGELNLTGHIKPAARAQIMAKEASKFGIATILSAQDKSLRGIAHLETFKNVYELLRLFPEDK